MLNPMGLRTMAKKRVYENNGSIRQLQKMHFKYNSPRHNDSRTTHRKLLDTQLRLSSATDSK
jgi:hypothetical protein